ncbi:RING finger protein 212B-like [Chanos chanos]|uniref:RING finger protein 212B-like n=1 Tax=Chanos chanos TaxID=29144 RepID=A0A6J2VFA2_CHACN|nr:RING finger protein 212B [Chanos chanos]
MEWFHCNACFQTSGQNFAVSSCGHIFCERCINLKQCSVCHTNCNYLPISEQMKPQEQVFFKDPMKLIQTRMEHIAQIDLFQRKQKERVIAFFRHKSTELERRLKEVNDQCYRQVSELKRENAELLKPLSQRRLRLPVSPGTFQTNGNTRRMSLPVAVTSPATANLEISWKGSETSTQVIAWQSGHMTPNNFQFQFIPGSTLQSPRPWHGHFHF